MQGLRGVAIKPLWHIAALGQPYFFTQIHHNRLHVLLEYRPQNPSQSADKSEFTVTCPFIKSGRSSSRCLVKFDISSCYFTICSKIGDISSSNLSTISLLSGMAIVLCCKWSCVICPIVVFLASAIFLNTST